MGSALPKYFLAADSEITIVFTSFNTVNTFPFNNGYEKNEKKLLSAKQTCSSRYLILLYLITRSQLFQLIRVKEAMPGRLSFMAFAYPFVLVGQLSVKSSPL